MPGPSAEQGAPQQYWRRGLPWALSGILALAVAALVIVGAWRASLLGTACRAAGRDSRTLPEARERGCPVAGRFTPGVRGLRRQN